MFTCFPFFSPQNGGGGLGPQSGGRTGHFSGRAKEVDWRGRGEEWDRAEEKGSADGAERMGGAEGGGGGNDRDTPQWCQPVSKYIWSCNSNQSMFMLLIYKCVFYLMCYILVNYRPTILYLSSDYFNISY